MKNKHLILLDLDGTTLYDWQSMTDETIQAIHQVKALGHEICIATGRPYRSSKVFYDQLELKTPIINYNGALIHHPYNSHFDEITREIDLNYILKVFNEIDHLIENAFCEYYEDIYLYKESKDIMPLIHPEGGKIIIGDFKETLHLNPNGFILLTYPDCYQEVEAFLSENFKGILDFRNWGGDYQQIIEIYTPETSKGNAMRYIQSYFDIPKERTISFGDGENDVEMIKDAGIGVAMENAVDSVKKAAKHITLSNKDNGVAHFLRKFFKLS
ncbi:HAD family phosphatase [Mycoplasmatota bacterium]|nr:HAD family phosphatase [Mycoplasmatota bacterium]